MIDTAFYNILANEPTIADLVAGEIYVGINPNPTDLYCVITQSRHHRPTSIDNVLGKQSARFQVDVYGKISPTVSALTNTIVIAVNGKSNEAHGHKIQLLRVDNEWSGYESATKLFRKSLEISVFFD